MSRILSVLALSAFVSATASASDVCFNAVQGKVAWNQAGATRWNPGNIERLCKGAEDSEQPARCFDKVMHGNVDRGGGSWGWSRVIQLCQGARDASARIGCLEREIAGGTSADAAVKRCRKAPERAGQRLRHRDRAVTGADYERGKLQGFPDRADGGDGDKQRIATGAIARPAGKDIVVNTGSSEASGRQRGGTCEQVSLTRDAVRLEKAEAGGNRLRLTGCFGNPDRDSVQVQIQSGSQIERRRARFRGTEATLRAPDIALDRGAVVSLLRTHKGDETYQLTPEVPIERARGDADGDGHVAREWGGDDCDDTDPDRFPGNTEVPDSDHRDEDCDPSTFGKVDEDRDGFFSDEYCNRQPSGELLCGKDCDDRYMNVNPAHHETPGDGIDNDCDGKVDEVDAG